MTPVHLWAKTPLLLKLLVLQTKLGSEPVTAVSSRLRFLDVFFSFGFAFDLCHICKHMHAAQGFGFCFVLFCSSYNGIHKACCVFIDLANA